MIAWLHQIDGHLLDAFIAGVTTMLTTGVGALPVLAQPLGVVQAYLLVARFQPLLPTLMGFAGGAMLYLDCNFKSFQRPTHKDNPLLFSGNP